MLLCLSNGYKIFSNKYGTMPICKEEVYRFIMKKREKRLACERGVKCLCLSSDVWCDECRENCHRPYLHTLPQTLMQKTTNRRHLPANHYLPGYTMHSPYNHNNTPADPSVRQALWLVHSPPPTAVAVVTAWKWRHDPTSCWCPAIMQWTRVLWGGGAVQVCDTVHNTPISSQQSVSSVGLSRQKIAASPSVSESLAAVSRHSELIVVLVTDLSSGQPLTHPVLVNDPPTATPSSDHRKL